MAANSFERPPGTALDTERLMARLVADAAPVRRLRPPMIRALSWLGAVGALGLLAILLFANMPVMEERLRNPELIVELAATLATGVLATVAAFHLSLPDRSRGWIALPLPTLAIWLAASGMGCWRQWVEFHGASFQIGESGHCLLFILGFGLPLSVGLMWALRRAKPLAPMPVAITGGLGAAALAAFLLQFFHPFNVTFMDLAFHATAVAIIVAVCGLSGNRALGSEA